MAPKTFPSIKFQVSPLEAVGLEGVFGFTMMSIFLVPMYYLYVGFRFGQNPRMVLEDALHGFVQVTFLSFNLSSISFTKVSSNIAIELGINCSDLMTRKQLC
jgi:hypothetical protein